MKLLNNKRSQAVGILMSSLHLDMKDIHHGEHRFVSICYHNFQIEGFFLKSGQGVMPCERIECALLCDFQGWKNSSGSH